MNDIRRKLIAARALFNGATTIGEKNAAKCAIERLEKRLGKERKNSNLNLSIPLDFSSFIVNIDKLKRETEKAAVIFSATYSVYTEKATTDIFERWGLRNMKEYKNPNRPSATVNTMKNKRDKRDR